MNDRQTNSSLILATHEPRQGVVVDREWTRQPANGFRWRHIAADGTPSAIAFDARRRRLALGGRSGWIGLCRLDEASADLSHPIQMTQLLAAGSILDLGFAEAGGLISSDVSGALCLWNPEEAAASRPIRLENPKEPIARLACLRGSHFAGVGIAGTVHVWNVADGVLLNAFPAGSTQPTSLVYDAERHGLFYANASGSVLFVNLSNGHVQCHRAHTGPCHVVPASDQRIVTIGAEDGRLIRWEAVPGGYRQGHEMPAPRGIRSVACVGEAGAEAEQTDLIVMVRGDGLAGVFRLDGTLRPLRAVGGTGYRMVHQPGALDLIECRQRCRMDEASALCRQIELQTQAGGQDVQPSLERLRALGFAARALRLEAEAARCRDDVLGELRALGELVRQLGWEGLAADELDRYGPMLKDFGLYREADCAIQALASHCPESCAANALPSGVVTAVASVEPKVVCPRPDLSLEQVLDAADAIGRPLEGLWQVQSGSRFLFGFGGLAAAQVVSAYNQLRQERGRETLPPAATAEAWWFQLPGAFRLPTVFVRQAGDPPMAPFVAALAIHTTALNSTIEPSVLFDAGELGDTIAAGKRPLDHNRLLRDQLSLMHSPVCAAWLHTIDQALGQVLRRLRSEAQPDWRL